MDFYTIDFETANKNLTSACSIGIVGVKNGVVKIKKQFLINPNEPFDDYTVSIHNITEEDVKDAPTFLEIWDEIKTFFTNTYVFSHNSSFDFNVLRSLLEKYDIEKPIFKFGCTVRMAKLLWTDGELQNHKLNTIANYLGIDFNHHNALSDALVCADIINRGLRIQQLDDVKSLYDVLELRFGYFGPKNFYNTYQMRKRSRKDIPRIYNEDIYDKLIIFSGKPKKMKKKDFVDKLISNGGYVDTIVSNKCDYFIKLNNCKSSKLNQIESLIDSGVEIRIFTEDEILKILK